MPNKPDTIEKLAKAAVAHVVFEGWGESTFNAAVKDVGLDANEASLLCPRGALDLAAASHKIGDGELIKAMAEQNLADMRIRDRVQLAIKLRLQVAGDKELVRRGSSLYSLPQHAPEGAKLIWDTADAIWIALGDNSDDVNWYSKRVILSAVYGSTVLFWLGDTSEDNADTWSFLDRRIENIMQFEDLKRKARNVPGLSKLIHSTIGRIRAPSVESKRDVPGWTRQEGDRK